jgi:type 2 lantibiotic biosynthesis protein LanM
VLYLLEATDVHFENTIASGENPYLIDLETLFHPRFQGELTAGDPANTMLRSSVLRVGMLPHRSFANAMEEGVDLSGVGGAAGQSFPFAVPSWQAVGTDEMQLCTNRGTTGTSHNLPKLAGESVEVAEYAESFIAGFTGMYKLLKDNRDDLLANDGPLASFANDETRIVIRPTVVYVSLRQAGYHPDVLHDAIDRDALYAWLWLSATRDRQFAKIVKAEIEELRSGDIPLFVGRPTSRALWTSFGECIPEFLSQPAMARVRQKLNDFGDVDLERQLWVIHASLTAVAGTHESTPLRRRVDGNTTLDRGRLIEEACLIGEFLERQALFGGGGSISWVGMIRNAKQHWSIAAPGIGLYDGVSGIALFCAYLAKETGQPRFALLARGALQTIRGHLADRRNSAALGAFDGIAGVVYLLSHLGVLWRDRALFEEAADLVQTIVQRAPQDRMFDVISGLGGCLAALIALYKVAPSDRLMNALMTLAVHLLNNAQPQATGIAWNTNIPSIAPLTGFAHGAAGIGWSLLELYHLTRKTEYRTAGISTFAYERHCYSPAERNWPDFRRLRNRAEAAFVRGWCHGSPGVILSRLRAMKHADCPELRAEVNAGLDTMDEAFGWSHCLCHGDFGNLEVLLQASELLQSQQWREKFERHLGRTLESGSRNGWLVDSPVGLESPGLMTGLAGVGFGLIRAAVPTEVPSVLILSPPGRT